MIKKYTTLITFSLLIIKLEAQQASGFTLQQAVEYAIKNSPSYLNAELDQKTAEYQRKELTGIGLPQIGGSAEVTNYLELPTSLLPGEFVGGPPGTFIPVKFGVKYNSTIGVSASQLIFSSDYIIGLKAAKEFINLSRINTSRSKAEVVANVQKAYYNVIINKDRVKLLDANLIQLKKIFDDTKALNKEGFAELIDVERLEVQYNNLKTEYDKVLNLISLSESFLKFQMGYKINEPITLTDSLNAALVNEKELMSSKADITKRPDYLLLQSQNRLYELDVKRQKYGYFPTLAAFGSYNYNAQRQKFDFFDGDQPWFKIALIGAKLNLTIFDGLQRHYKIQQSKVTLQKSANNIKNIELVAELEATSANITYKNAASTMQIQNKNMELAQHVYDVAQKKYTAGVGSNIEILTAETTLKEARTNYYNALYDMLVAKIDYQKAIGTLTN
jgi:outer membrane protein